MPEMTPVGNQIVPPDIGKGLSNISSILGLRQQQQNLQTGLATQKSAQAAATIDTQTATENQNLAKLLADPVGNGIIDGNGKILDGAMAKIQAAAPTTGAQHYEQFTKAATSKVAFNNALNNLNQQERADITGPVSLRAADPNAKPEDIMAAIDQVVESKKGTPLESDYATVGDTYRHIMNLTLDKSKGTAQTPGKELWRTTARGLNQQILPPDSISGANGIAMPSNASIDTGTQVQPGVTQPAMAGGGFTPSGAPIDKTSVISLPNGQQARLNAATGRYELLSQGATGAAPATSRPAMNAAPRTAQQDAPPPNAPKQDQDAYSKAVETTNQHVEQVRHADIDYGNNTAVSNMIRHLSKDTSTGPGSHIWQNAMAGLHVNSGSNYQELGAFLDRQAATLRTQMDLPGTNAGAADSRSIAGNTNYTPKAIQDKNDYTQALTEGLHQYRNGLDRIAGFGGRASPNAVNAFKAAWTNAFDPNVFKGELAFKRSKEEGRAFIASLDPAEAASLKAKRAALQALSQGQMPQ